MAEKFRFPIAVTAVAAGAALFAIAFRLSLGWAYATFFGARSVIEAVERLPVWLRFVVPVAGALVAGTIARVSTRRSQNVSNVMEAVALGRVHLSMRATASRVAASWAAIAGGMSIGREGPLIEFGGSLGAAVGRTLRMALEETRLLIAGGTAAGFAAAYNTPFAAVTFVLETIMGVATPVLLLPVICTTVVATALTRMLAGPGPIYGQRSFGLGSYLDLVSFAVLGALAAVAAVGFKGVLAWFENLVDRYPVAQPLRAMIGGGVVGAIAIRVPTVAGNGYEPLNALLDRPLPVAAVGVLVLAKVVATGASVGSGVPGGIFTPMLLVGAGLGSAWAQLAGTWAAPAASAGSFALVGMAAATAASIHAPLTAAVMVFELSGDYQIVLPLLLATTAATSVSRALGSESIYDRELRKRGLGWDLTLDGRQVHASRG